ncbi:hypothetical protein [Paenibacillus periandrae]|uniref:hypothetical protein n=1 Tax=Paenibacillus periandrae TaxID=1761741 RepID=UPI001F097E00|nr:hypothetical protein [Paenibacillus periandrae]
MRQMITIDQLNELDSNQKEQLRKWWNPSENDYYILNLHNSNPVLKVGKSEKKEYSLPLLNIGLCIDIIDKSNSVGFMLMREHETFSLFFAHKPTHPSGEIDGWTVSEIEDDGNSCELIDYLWESVKLILNKRLLH